MKHYKHTLIAFLAIVVLSVPWLVTSYPQSRVIIDRVFGYIGNNFALVFMRQSVTVAQLKNKYDSAPMTMNKVKILIVPGHEADFGGTSFKDLNERDIVVNISKYLEEFLKNNQHYEVTMARDKVFWNPILDKYFKEHWSDIIYFLSQSKKEMVHLVNNGSVIQTSNGVVHNAAAKDVALRLYGINKWANENKIDLVIHVHFNDYPRKNSKVPGEYSGFAIYVPEKQYSNSTTTRAVADTVFKRLAKNNSVSDFPNEDIGVVEDQELIAVGAHNTLEAPSMLIEYGYIYEKRFTNPDTRDAVFKDLAFQTYMGIQDFFGENNNSVNDYNFLRLK